MRKLRNNSNSHEASVQAIINYCRCDAVCPRSNDDFYSYEYHYRRDSERSSS